MWKRLGGMAATGTAVVMALTGLTGCSKNASADSDSVLPLFSPKTPGDWAREAVDISDPDKRRRAIAALSSASFGHEPPYVRLYRLLIDDHDPTVRAACLRALAKHGEVEDVSRVLPYLEDETKVVRWEAAKALQRLHRDDAVDPLLKRLREDQDADVRIAAANALAQYPQPRVFEGLVGTLNDDDYGVVAQSVASLELLTGQHHGEDGGQWLDWADDADRAMFANQQAYYYPQFNRPRTLWEKVQFWKKQKPIIPQQPEGLEPVRQETPTSAAGANGP